MRVKNRVAQQRAGMDFQSHSLNSANNVALSYSRPKRPGDTRFIGEKEQ